MVGTLELQVVDTPLLNPIDQQLTECDDNTDGIVFFDLTQIENETLGNLNPNNLSISYHLNESDAQTGNNPITDAENYQNISNPQTLWIRAIDTTNSASCFDLKPLILG